MATGSTENLRCRTLTLDETLLKRNSRGRPLSALSSLQKLRMAKVPPKYHQDTEGKQGHLRVCLQTIDFIELFGSVIGARTRTLRLERATC
jgi:hypothetical protein